jgi:AbrB family looped-hinge helix DNA binding protein
MNATVTVKGQVVIPAEIRKRLGVKKGTRLHVEERGGAIIMHPLNRKYFERMAGILEGPSATRALEESRTEDLKREEAKYARLRSR